MFEFLFGKKKLSNRLKFVQGICEKHEPKIAESWLIGYIFEFKLKFPDCIRITVEYNTVRHEWDVEIWNNKTSNILFYYDCLDRKPHETINYLVKRFDLRERLHAAIDLKELKDKSLEAIDDGVIEKYSN